MKIVSKLCRPAGETCEPRFPALYRARNSDYTVLFISEGKGMVVQAAEGANNPLGHYSENWVSCSHSGCWVPIAPGESITLTVE